MLTNYSSHPDREKKHVSGTAGFSLIELLVVVAILAVLAAIAIPVFLNQKNKAANSQIPARVHELVTETESYRIPLPPNTNVNLAALSGVIQTYHTANPTRVGAAIMPNCAINASGTAAYASPGNYIISANLANGASTWTAAPGSDVIVYNSADSKWYTNNTTVNTLVGGGVGAGTSRDECGSSWYSGAVYLQSNK